MPKLARALHTLTALALLAALTGCGHRTDQDPSTTGAALPGPGTPLSPRVNIQPGTFPPFAVIATSVPSGAIWQLNRPIDVEFNKDVDFGTVSSSTIRIVDGLGAPVVGTFALAAPRRVRFQPLCPTNETNSNGGFRQGRAYVLDVPAQGVTVLSTAGEQLQLGVNVPFTTPVSNDPLVLFLDDAPGPPRVRVRGLAGEPMNSDSASFIEFGDGTTEFFVFDPLQQSGVLTADVPLNLYSQTESQFALVLRFDQSIDATASNVSSSFIDLEYSYDQVNWNRAPSSVELTDNCTEIGASVRLRPSGVAAQGATMRLIVRAGFRDLTGDPLLTPITNAAVFGVELAHPGSAAPADGSDEILETFELSGVTPGSLEDTAFPSNLPRASWSVSTPGALEAGFDFEGTGGPGGDFDWRITTGQTILLNTVSDQIIGGPGGQPSFIQTIVNGVVDLDDLIMEPGSRLLVFGPNPLTILATGDVTIEGLISVNGGNSFGVQTLNTTNQPEQGAAGQAGGGDGGTGSFLTTQSTPMGGDGLGAFNVPRGGGVGGESSYAPSGTCSSENRRGAGGGGGRFGADIFYEWVTGSPTGLLRCQTMVGMDAEPGFTGSPDGTGAVSQSVAAVGGPIGPSPFRDARDDNDFFGTMITAGGEQIVGELPGIWAGSGGGAGGDASRTANFPMTPFSPVGDEKGCGGGGGAGGLLILAIGDIDVSSDGSIRADGGTGGGGENVIFFDRVGGGSGGGSGGHIVLSSASTIRIAAEATSAATGPFYLDDPVAPVHERRPLRALGGQGGAGKDSRCGSNENGPTQWRADAIPPAAFEGNVTVPPQNQNIWLLCNRVDTCAIIEPPEGVTPGAGGDGSPGIIQLHVGDPATQLLFPNATGTYGVDLDPTRSMAPPPLGWTAPNLPVDVMVPFFGARSASVSRWIPLGLARLDPPNGSLDQVELAFDGTDPVTGQVPRSGSSVQELAPLFDYAALSQGGAAPSVDAVTATFVIPGAGFDELYRLNAALTRQFAVRIRDAGSAANASEFIVQSGSYDAASDTFDLVVDPRGTELVDVLLMASSPEVALVPFFYRLVTGGVSDVFPASTGVGISFDATILDPLTGEPSVDPADAFSGGNVANFATDVMQLNLAAWDVLRFRVEFDLDTTGTGVDVAAPRPGLDFLRLPYRF